MTPEARAAAIAALRDLSQENSPLRAQLFLAFLQRASRGDTDRHEYPRGHELRAPTTSEQIADQREARARERESRENDACDEAECTARAGQWAWALQYQAGGAEGTAGASRLDSGVTSDRRPDPLDRAIHLAADRDPTWLVRVETLTAPHRTTRAARHRRAASLALAGLVPGGVSNDPGDAFEPSPDTRAELSKEDLERLWARLPMAIDRDGLDVDATWQEFERWMRKDAAARRARWHWGRGRGHLRRFSTVVGCGHGKIVAKCKGCGVIHEQREFCGAGLVCVACRARKAKKRNRRFASAQGHELRDAGKRGLYRHRRKGGRWGQRFVTLTIPHVGADRWADEAEGVGAVAARVRLLFAAWRKFSLRMQAWGRKIRRRDGRSIAWYRAFEWTLGADMKGHPHFHLWVHSPFLAESDVAEWWAEALTRVGYPVSSDRVIVSVRGARPDVHRELTKGTIAVESSSDGARMVRYVEGWSIRDVDEAGNVISPEVAAALYAALDGRRLVQTSRGLLEPPKKGCSMCGAHRSVTVSVTRNPADTTWKAHGRGPPRPIGPPT